MFKQTTSEFIRSKTNWTGLSMIITGAMGGYYKIMNPVESTQTIMAGIGLIAVKDAVAKNDTEN